MQTRMESYPEDTRRRETVRGTGAHDTMTIDYEKIKRLVSLVEQNRLSELTVEEADLSITIKAEIAGPTPVTTPAADTSIYVDTFTSEIPEVEVYGEAIPQVEEASPHRVEIISPMVGVFYKNPSPDSPPFVEVGDEVEEGQTVGLIEAMKVFSEVPSEVAGRVVAIPAESGKLVQQGDVLVVVDTSHIER